MKRTSILLAGALALSMLTACSVQAASTSASASAPVSSVAETEVSVEALSTVLVGEGKTASPAVAGMTMLDGALYGTDTYHNTVWKYEDGEYSVLTGRTDVTDASGRPAGSLNDAALDEAAFSGPWGIVPYADGFLVADRDNNVVRYIDLEAGRVYTALGTGEEGSRDGAARYASFRAPTGMAVGDDGTVYIADTGNNAIRALDADGNVTTYAGGEEGCALGSLDEARFAQPTGLCWANGALYVADSGNHRIVAIADGEVTLVAGAELTGDAAEEGACLDGAAAEACFASPQGVAVASDGTVYIADTGNGAVRMLSGGKVTTLEQIGGGKTYPVSPCGILLDGADLYVGDVFARVLLHFDA